VRDFPDRLELIASFTDNLANRQVFWLDRHLP
jgi:hypothetical protein